MAKGDAFSGGHFPILLIVSMGADEKEAAAHEDKSPGEHDRFGLGGLEPKLIAGTDHEEQGYDGPTWGPTWIWPPASEAGGRAFESRPGHHHSYCALQSDRRSHRFLSKRGAIRPRAKLRGSRPDYHLPPWYPNDSDHFQKRSGCACFNGLSCHSRGSAAKSAVNSLPSHSRARFERDSSAIRAGRGWR